MQLKYGLEDRLPGGELLLYGLQWLAIAVPTVVIIGKVVAVLHAGTFTGQVIYLQKLFFVMAVSLLVQLLWGHRLPLVMGPAAVLLVGIVATRGSNLQAVYTSIAVGGFVLTLLSVTGLFGYLKKLFTSRVIATILVLIAFALSPTIMDLILEGPAAFNICFALIFVTCMFIASRLLSGIWKSTLIMWSIIAGSLLYVLFIPSGWVFSSPELPAISLFFQDLHFQPVWNPGVLISFLICFLALAINDLGSIQSVGEMLHLDNLPRRITRGISFTGLANVFAGLLGVIGSVNFSLSPGVIASTGCASRYTLLPAALGLLVISFLPGGIAFMGSIPTVVIGTVLLYIMTSQIAAGLILAVQGLGGFTFDDGLVMGLPFMLAIIVSFLPGAMLDTFPPLLRPVIGNGFVIGVLAVLIMEHLIFKER